MAIENDPVLIDGTHRDAVRFEIYSGVIGSLKSDQYWTRTVIE